MTKKFEFVERARSKCPCGGEIASGDMIIDGEPVPCVMHQQPYCQKFEELEPGDFLHYVNVMQGKWN